MAGDPVERQFSDREVSRILETAAELERREPAERGLSLAELERVGSEVGLDPALVRRAVREVDARGAHARAGRFLGGPTELSVERVVPGEAGPAALRAVLDALWQESGDLGEVSGTAGLFQWRGRLDKARLDVHVASGEGRTVVRVRMSLTELAADVFGSRFVVVGGGSAFLVVAATVNMLGPAAALLGGGIAAAGYAAARLHYAWLAPRYHARATALADALAERVSAGGDAP